MVPNGWKKMSLSTVAEIRTGVAKGKQNLKNPVELPYLRVANVQDGYIDISNIKTIQIEKGQIERYSLKAGDVLMTEGGDFDKLGRGDVWNGEITPCLHQNHVFAVRTDTSKLSPHFLAALSASHYGKSYFLGCSKRSTNLASINSTQLKEFPVLVPPLAEQNKITQILSTWDKAIKTLEKLIENSRTQKKALVQQLLTGKRRLPGFSCNWKEVYLSSIANITMGTSPNSDSYNENGDGLPLIQGNADIKGRKSTPRIYTSEITKTCESGDILLSVRAPVGTVAISYHKACIGRGIAAVSAKPNYSTKYIYQALLAFEPRWISISQGSTFDAVNSHDVKKLSLLIPASKEEQNAITRILEAQEKLTENLTYYRDALVAQKKALMQQLLTGKRRVKVDES
jgi:type I restriction enzyme S subunit